jgi:hypothetical protein
VENSQLNELKNMINGEVDKVLAQYSAFHQPSFDAVKTKIDDALFPKFDEIKRKILN